MIPPLQVDKIRYRKGRCLAWAFWLTLLALFIVYATVAIHSAYKKREKPPTRLSYDNSPWLLPHVGMDFTEYGGITRFNATCSIAYTKEIGHQYDKSCNSSALYDDGRRFYSLIGGEGLEIGSSQGFAGVTLLFDTVNVVGVRRVPYYFSETRVSSETFEGFLSFGLITEPIVSRILVERKLYKRLGKEPRNGFDPIVTETRFGHSNTNFTYALMIELAYRPGETKNGFETLVIEEIDPVDWIVLYGLIAAAFGSVGVVFGIFFATPHPKRSPLELPSLRRFRSGRIESMTAMDDLGEAHLNPEELSVNEM